MNRNVEFGEFQRLGRLVRLVAMHQQCLMYLAVESAGRKSDSRVGFSSPSARTFLTSLWQRCIRTLMPLRLQFQLNVRTIHPDFVGTHPLRRWRAEHLAGANFEPRAMPGASDLVALEFPL